MNKFITYSDITIQEERLTDYGQCDGHDLFMLATSFVSLRLDSRGFEQMILNLDAHQCYQRAALVLLKGRSKNH